MPPSDFANVNINEILDKLSTEDAVKLIAGVGHLPTASIERLGIPAIPDSQQGERCRSEETCRSGLCDGRP